jgi:putative nucleotidyltransferase with HDIG domain
MSISGTLVVLGFRLPETTLDWSGIATLTGAVLLNAFASAILTAILQFVLAQFLGLTTALQLVEISRPDHPLLQFILRNAPGTYQHSLQVANLAEQAAERIGADALLTRIGALYHDAGKALEPFYFIENQLPDSPNPHNRLDPVDSSAIIIRHISDGMILAQKYRLPRRIRDFIREHHGTMLARYQYAKAVEAAGGDASLVPQDQFLYPGPRPQSRETAILMLADGSEARVRAERPKDEEAMRVVIKSVIENRLAAGQLDDTDLTLKDLDEIADSFASTLRGIYHPRLEYPQLAKTIPASVSPEPLPKARA